MPTTPLAAAGARIDRPVSLPVAAKHRPAAIAAAEPPLEPDGMWSRFHAFLVGGESKPSANSCVVTFPKTIAPASLSLRTTVQSESAT